ncbi:MAG: UTP:GlnB (protein PII) uridylyltransferase, partial [Candidatus Azotimanducaceae bacterium]
MSSTPIPTRAKLEQELTSSKRAIPVLKQALEMCRQNLEARFHEDENAESLIEGRASFVDMILQLAW